MKKLLTAVLTAILALGACFSFAACGDEKKPSEIGIGDGTLVIGYTIYPPMNYEEDGKFVGFDTDLAIAVCDYLKVDYEFKEIVWKNKVMSLNSKEIDVVWNGMTITDDRAAQMCISVPYLFNKQVAVILKSGAGKYTSKESMKKAIMTAETGSAGETVIVGEQDEE